MKTNQPSLTLALLEAREALMSHFRPELKEIGLTEQQWCIMRILAQDKELDTTTLAEKACLLKPSLTGITNRLIDIGLIDRRRSEQDQRIYYISLTDRGEKVFSNAVTRMEQCHTIIEEKIGEEKMLALFNLLKDIQNIR